MAIERRLELLKLEGLGFSQPEIVKELSQKFACSERTVYRDFECRQQWQPELQHIENHSRILMKVVNRYEQIYRQASIKLLTGSAEAMRLEWRDFDFEKGTVCINNPEKNSLPRMLPISPTLQAMLNSLQRKNKRVFNSKENTMQSSFRKQRNRLAIKLKNQRLTQIHFHTFRHFYATTLFARTLNLLRVQQALGHRSINNTMIYTQLIDFKSDEYEVQIATTVDEAKKLGEAGFEHYDTMGDKHLYKKRK
jgi:integrase